MLRFQEFARTDKAVSAQLTVQVVHVYVEQGVTIAESGWGIGIFFFLFIFSFE